MPIYRASNPSKESARRNEGEVMERLVSRRPRSQVNVELEERRRLRSATPAVKALPRTLGWVSSLPPDVQPTALLRHYARIANVIAATWGHATSFRSYMDCLFRSERETRRGFPREVLVELIALRRYHDALMTCRFRPACGRLKRAPAIAIRGNALACRRYPTERTFGPLLTASSLGSIGIMDLDRYGNSNRSPGLRAQSSWSGRRRC